MADNTDNTDYNSDEILASMQGGDDKTIESQRKTNPEPEPDGEPDGGVDPDSDQGEPSGEPDGGEEGGSDISDEEREEISNNLTDIVNSFSDNPSEENLEIKKDLLDHFKGKDFDEQGNILGEDGEILVDYDKVVDHVASQEDANFDEDGNEVDAEGNIITTKDQLEGSKYHANKLAKNLGYSFEDENGNPKVYSDGDEGVNELIQDVTSSKNEEFKNEFLSSNPVLTEVAKHLLSGKDLDTFDKPISYSDVSVKDVNKDSKYDFIKKSFIAEGQSEERAEKNAKRVSEKDLDSETEEALSVLQGFEDKKTESRQAELDAKVQEQQRQDEEYWGTVNNTIKSGKLENFNIPDKEKEKFFNYLAIPIKDNKSQDMLDREKSTLEGRLKEAYYRYKGGDFTDSIKEEVGRSKVNSIRARMKKNSMSSKESGNKRRGKRNTNSEVSLKALHNSK